jgi:hypothetical protein
MFDLEAFFLHQVTYKVEVDLNMFHTQMFNWVKIKMSGTEIVT